MLQKERMTLSTILFVGLVVIFFVFLWLQGSITICVLEEMIVLLTKFGGKTVQRAATGNVFKLAWTLKVTSVSKSISYFRVLGNKGHAVYEAKAFEKHFNMYKVLHFMVCMGFLMKSKGFFIAKISPVLSYPYSVALSLSMFSRSESCTQNRVIFYSCQHIDLVAFSVNLRQQNSNGGLVGKCHACLFLLRKVTWCWKPQMGGNAQT